MEKIMEMLFDRIVANSIPISVALLLVYLYGKYTIYPFFKNLVNRIDVIEDKQEASIITLHNGKYEQFKEEYERLAKERERLNKK